MLYSVMVSMLVLSVSGTTSDDVAEFVLDLKKQVVGLSWLSIGLLYCSIMFIAHCTHISSQYQLVKAWIALNPFVAKSNIYLLDSTIQAWIKYWLTWPVLNLHIVHCITLILSCTLDIWFIIQSLHLCIDRQTWMHYLLLSQPSRQPWKARTMS